MNTSLSMLRPTSLLCGLALVINAGSVGCSSSGSPRSDTNISEIDPAIANLQRQRAQAIEHYTIASQLNLDEKYDEALIEYRRALELDDQLYAAWNNMGQLLLSQGNYADAVSAYQIASGLEPTDPRPEYNIGHAYQKVGWAQDAYNHFELALDRDPNYMPALHGIIRSAEMLGLGDAPIMGYIRNAQLRETDDQWRAYLSTQYYRVQAILDN